MIDRRPSTLSWLHSAARRALQAAGLDEAALDARLLVEAITGTGRTDLISSPDMAIDEDLAQEVAQSIRRRLTGEPVHRILGRREFYGLELLLSPETLEPRPDTEALVDLVLPALAEAAARRGAVRVLDLGTGTGAVALALLSRLPQAVAVGTDISQGALDTAAANARRLGFAPRFSTVRCDWFDGVEGRFDLIVSNPPYIESADIAGLPPEVRLFDPPAALDGGADGLDAYRGIASGAGDFLTEGGLVGVEIGHLQRQAVVTIFNSNGYSLAAEARDLAGRDRALMFARAARGSGPIELFPQG